jgi:hypothetical protein
MSTTAMPFPLPDKLAPGLARVLAYWEGLKRADNAMPFWDDVKLSALPDLASGLMLIDAFEAPERFRFNTVGAAIDAHYGENITGKFVDDIASRAPVNYLRAQCSATIEARLPSCYDADYVRLLLPMWGDGHIGMLLGAVERL